MQLSHINFSPLAIWLQVVLFALPVQARPPQPLRAPVLESDAPKPPWSRRRRRGVHGMQARGHGLIDITQWPAEPATPDSIDAPRFATALRSICGWMPKRRPLRYAQWIIKYSEEFAVDPFVVAALIYRQSICIPSGHSDFGIGLTRINERMHRGFIRKRHYHYWTLEDGSWRAKKLAMPRFPFIPKTIQRAQANIYFTAALLAVWTVQCPAIDGALGSVPHRHAVSHLIWGDRVKNAGPEDRILRARRRLLRYYHGRQLSTLRGNYKGLTLQSPLDGAPRKLTSIMGEPRDNGRRKHKGVDFSSTWGEPVRAVAAGKVVFAGIDMLRGPGRSMPFEQAKTVDSEQFGPGGYHVMIRHQNGLLSAYMHLSAYDVERGQTVAAGQRIGRVGKSGIKESKAHLHFELRYEGRHIDPVPHLRPIVFLPAETYIGRNLAYERWRVARRNRKVDVSPTGEKVRKN